jgi:signal peptidase II
MAIPVSRDRAPLRLGLLAAAVAAVIDQAAKLWLLYGFGRDQASVTSFLDLLLSDCQSVLQPLSRRVPVTSFLDLVLVCNTGISYGLFQEAGPVGQWALFGLKVIAVILLGLWLTRTASHLAGVALGLIIGGALGNAIDRLLHGAVIDFVLFHITAATWTFRWYVFNLADAAIVAGVVGLLYESLFVRGAAKAP